MAEKRVYLHTVRQWTAGLLLMLSVGIVGGKGDFDPPHQHSDSEPSFPTTFVGYSDSGNVSPGVVRFSSRGFIPENERLEARALRELSMATSRWNREG